MVNDLFSVKKLAVERVKLLVRSGDKPLIVKVIVIGAANLCDGFKLVGEFEMGFSSNGLNPVDAQTASYQWGAQTPSVSRGPSGQASMFSSKVISSAAQRARKTPSGFSRTSFASMTGQGAPRSAQFSEILRCTVKLSAIGETSSYLFL